MDDIRFTLFIKRPSDFIQFFNENGCLEGIFQDIFKFLNQFIFLLQSHLREKCYTCPACSESFTRKKLLDKHMMTVHRGTPYFKCEVCPRGFCSRSGLLKHIR